MADGYSQSSDDDPKKVVNGAGVTVIFGDVFGQLRVSKSIYEGRRNNPDRAAG